MRDRLLDILLAEGVIALTLLILFTIYRMVTGN